MTAALQIDIAELKEALQQQPGYMHSALVAYAEALDARDGAKTELEKVRARLYLKILNDNDKKPTEAAIQAVIATDPVYLAAQETLRDAELHVGKAVALRDGMHHRKSSLENLTRLVLADWYSEPGHRRPDVQARVRAPELAQEAVAQRAGLGPVPARDAVEEEPEPTVGATATPRRRRPVARL